MKKNIQKKGAFAALLGLCLVSLSFTTAGGGDEFQLFVGNKMVIQQYIYNDKAVKHLELAPANYNEKISFRYMHCGQAGKNRMITLKDKDGNVMKQWSFANPATSENAMICNAKEIMDIQVKKGDRLQVYYSSVEIPKGKLLVTISRAGNSVAAK